MEKIVILIPTYNRPHSVINFMEFVDRYTSNPELVEVVFGGHSDDPKTKQVIESRNGRVKCRHINLKKWKDNKPHLTYFWNQLYAATTQPIIGFFGDDVQIKTKGWDKLIIAEFKKEPHILVYGNDVHCAKGTGATLFFTHRSSHEACGYYMFERYRRIWMDQFWDFVFNQMGRRIYIPQLITEHLHPGIFSSRVDETYLGLERLMATEAGFDAALQPIKDCKIAIAALCKETCGKTCG